MALLTGWTNDPERGDPLEHLASRSRFDRVDSENVLDINAVYILDILNEAHATYNDLQFWLIAVKNSPDVALFYNAQEYEDVIERLCSRSPTTCELSREAKDYLFAITSGHAGATTSMVTYVYDVKTIPCLLYTMWGFTS